MADEATERITILLQAKDREFARAMERNNKVIARFARQADRDTSSAVKRIDSNLSGIASTAANFGKGMVAGIGAGLIGAALAAVSSDVRATIGEIADLADTAERVGVDVESLQGLQDGFKLAGVEAASFNSGLEKFVENIGDAARGTGAFGQILRANSIAVKNTDGTIRDTTAILQDYADLIASVPDEAARMSLITEAFGRGGKAMVLALGQGSAGLNQMITDAKAAGRVLDADVVAKAAILDDKFDMLGASVGVFFKTLVVNAADGVTSLSLTESALDRVIAKAKDGHLEIERLKHVLPEDDYTALTSGDAVSPEAKAAVDDLSSAYNSLQQAAADASAVLAGEVDYLTDRGETAAAQRLAALSATIDVLSADFLTNKISADEYQAGLAAVADAAVVAVAEIDAIDGIDLSNAVSVIGGLSSMMSGLAAEAAKAAQAVAAAVLAGPSGMTTGTPLTVSDNLLPPSEFAPTVSPRPKRTPIIFDGELPGDLPTGGGGGGGGSANNDQLREAERLYEATRTEAEKYAAELANIEALQAGGYIDAETYARAVEQVGEKYHETADAAKAFEDAGREAFVGIVTGAENAQDAVANLLDRLAEMLANEAFTALMDGSFGEGSGLLSGIGKLLSFEGGGSTGSGARSGGLDGKGGYMAMVHPQEYITDMTKPGAGVQSSNSRLSVGVSIDGGGNLLAVVRDEAGRVLAQNRASLVRDSMTAVQRANRATKAFLS